MFENNNDKVIVNVELYGEAKKNFLELKQKCGIEQNSEVIRWALAFANKRFIIKG